MVCCLRHLLRYFLANDWHVYANMEVKPNSLPFFYLLYSHFSEEMFHVTSHLRARYCAFILHFSCRALDFPVSSSVYTFRCCSVSSLKLCYFHIWFMLFISTHLLTRFLITRSTCKFAISDLPSQRSTFWPSCKPFFATFSALMFVAWSECHPGKSRCICDASSLITLYSALDWHFSSLPTVMLPETSQTSSWQWRQMRRPILYLLTTLYQVFQPLCI